MAEQRLQKLIAAAGVCSRRKAEQLLRQERVTVDGRLASIGDKADPDTQSIRVDGVLLTSERAPIVLLMNKPVGYVCTCHDPHGRSTVLDLIPERLQSGLHPVGRLDADSRGALLLSNNGDFTLKMTHPRYDHTKTYHVWVKGEPSLQALQQWSSGVVLDGRRTRPANVQALKYDSSSTLLRITLMEGRNRQIRRVSASLGHPVVDLQRIEIAGLSLGRLEEGAFRKLSQQEWMPLIKSEA